MKPPGQEQAERRLLQALLEVVAYGCNPFHEQRNRAAMPDGEVDCGALVVAIQSQRHALDILAAWIEGPRDVEVFADAMRPAVAAQNDANELSRKLLGLVEQIVPKREPWEEGGDRG